LPPSARLSQVFLCDRDAVERIASATPIRGKTVLEIGAGEGILTKALSEKAGPRGKIIALEIDRLLAPKLEKNLRGAKNVEVNFVDALDFNYAGYKIIFGNLPYHLSSKILFKILAGDFEKAILCLQKEFAFRLTAPPGDREYSRLSVMAQNFCDARVLFEIPRYSFVPMPEVDSSVVLLEKNKKFDLNDFLVALLFQHKNQSVRNAFVHSRKALGIEKSEALARAEKMPFKDRRPKELALEEYAELSGWFGRIEKLRK